MPENELIITIDNDDDIINTKDMDTSRSPNSSKSKRTRLTFPFGSCRVCSDSATGIHYGIATCEGCKGFFKRSILRKEKYRCYFDNICLINVTNRNRCKACRFRRCIDEGMSVDGVKMGRIPKLVKERALKELKEQQMKQEAALAETTAVHPRETSCSSLSDGSIENYDPNSMEINSIKSQVSPIQRHNDLTYTYTNDNLEKKLSFHHDNHHSDIKLNNEENKSNSSIIYRTKYSSFLPEDFTVDETNELTEQTTGLLNNDVFKYVKTIANKLNINQLNLHINLDEDEITFIRYLRWSSYNIYLRHSKRLKQTIYRMNQIIEKNIQEYPGDNATLAQFFNSIRLSCQVYIRSSVVYVQELPGMKNISVKSLEKIIAHRSFDWFLLKHHELFHDNGQCYFLGPDGFQYTRYWLDELHGVELTDAMFNFCQRLRKLNLTETEFSLVLPLHVCYYDSIIEEPEIPRMLWSCYFYALYSELCHNRGQTEGKIMCTKILQTLEMLIPMVATYQTSSASRILEV